ncbi:MAG: glycosyltransferase family 9 protein [Candidatus Omnitrophota bacterium]
MVRPYSRDIVLGNPYLDEIIIYDKEGTRRTFLQTVRFALGLRRKKFDLALILHPANRAHLIAFLAGIKKRIGFNRKLDFLLTDRIEHKKQEGTRHELEYTLDFVRFLGIEPREKELFMPVHLDSETYIEQFLLKEGVGKEEKVIAIHPAASCPSKVWPMERFVQVAARIADEFNARIVFVGGQGISAKTKETLKLMPRFHIDALGKTTVSQLASLLRRCCLFLSNDSGPVHIAAAFGVPVVAIFGRKQAGLSPTRWAPVSPHSVVLHKDVGCVQCWAHNCSKGFACLEAISVEDVMAAVRNILRNSG